MSPRMGIDITDINRLAGLLQTAAGPKFKTQSKAAMLEWARLVRTTAIDRIQRSVPSGRIYNRVNPRRTVRASAPGQPPAIDMGHFVSTIYIAPITQGYRVGTRDPRGFWFEFGTLDMAPRPWLFPAVRQSTGSLNSILSRHLRPF